MLVQRVCARTVVWLSAESGRRAAAWSAAAGVCARESVYLQGNGTQHDAMMVKMNAKGRTMSTMSTMSSRTAIENRLLYRSKQRGFLELDIILVGLYFVCV